MKKYKRISILIFLIISIAAGVFYIYKNENITELKITDNDIKKMIKEKHGFDVEIIDRIGYNPVDTVYLIDQKEIKRKERPTYTGIQAKVRTTDRKAIEFTVSIIKEKGKPMEIVENTYKKSGEK